MGVPLSPSARRADANKYWAQGSCRGGRDPLKPLKPLELRSFGGGPSSPL